MSNSPVTYVLAYSDSLNRATIESTEPGQAIKVHVVPDDNLAGKPTVATGQRSADGKSFLVKVGEGQEAGDRIDWGWGELMERLQLSREGE